MKEGAWFYIKMAQGENSEDNSNDYSKQNKTRI